MLTQLTVNDFAIVDALDIEFGAGMTTITGETGAGKSIAIDAISLCLGARGEATMVRPGGKRADISASFSVEGNKPAQKFLRHHELDNEDACIIRRVISKEGRSKGFINGKPVPISQLKEIGIFLLNIHGQHAHQGLLDGALQLSLLDQYANHQKLNAQVALSHQNHQQIKSELKQLQQAQQQAQAKVQLLEYQVEELDAFALTDGEFEQIETEHQRLSNSESIQLSCHRLLNQLSDDDSFNLESALNSALHTLDEIIEQDSSIEPLAEMLNGALIQIQESSQELASYQNAIEQNPERLAILDERLSKAMQLARKHHVSPQELPALHQSIHDELQAMTNDSQRIDDLEVQLAQVSQQYFTQASELSQSRKKYATKLEKLVTKSMKKLSMEHGEFAIAVAFNKDGNINKNGLDAVSFLVTTNPGQPLDALNKVVSGGELSRISLAISVITANKVATPTLIFDEVDVGISGPTAAAVGEMLRELGKSTQIACVTHLPQVAGCGHHQMRVVKKTDGRTTNTTMVALSENERVQELARLLGGNTISDNTVANAQELLRVNQS
ncbi:MAG: DNA repair protein RecN [Gammaproteobacteria bacterium MedPE]|nr:MAG: DNA repair protein RecN [Gammaproteobacteria bacterium MedPE]